VKILFPHKALVVIFPAVNESFAFPFFELLQEVDIISVGTEEVGEIFVGNAPVSSGGQNGRQFSVDYPVSNRDA
jgi:hypothetical protein